MLKKIYLNNLFIGMGIGALISISYLLENNPEYIKNFIGSIVVGGFIGIAVPFAHQFVNPKKFISWYSLNFIVAYGILLLVNLQVFTKESEIIIRHLLELALKLGVFMVIPSWWAYSKYRLGNKFLKKKQEEFIKK